jgi:dihydrolipoamide dehydrogenase
MEKFDLVVIGSGPGGYTAAVRALDFKKHVCIVEANEIGGTGIVNGVLTSKQCGNFLRLCCCCIYR